MSEKVKLGRIRYIIALILLVLIAIFTVAYRFLPEETQNNQQTQYSANIPLQIGEWKGIRYPPPEKVCEDLKTNDIFIGKYVNDYGQTVSLSIAFLSRQFPIHNPERCFIGTGWKEADKVTEEIELPNNKQVNMTRVVFEKDGRKFMAMYAFKIGDRTVSSYIYYEILRSVGLRSRKNILFYLSTDSVDNISQVTISMKRFAQKVFSVLPEEISFL